MMTGNDSNVTHALFSPAAAININHLGLSTKSCFDSKMKLAKLLADRNIFLMLVKSMFVLPEHRMLFSTMFLPIMLFITLPTTFLVSV